MRCQSRGKARNLYTFGKKKKKGEICFLHKRELLGLRLKNTTWSGINYSCFLFPSGFCLFVVVCFVCLVLMETDCSSRARKSGF